MSNGEPDTPPPAAPAALDGTPVPLLMNDRAGALKHTASALDVQKLAESIGLRLEVVTTEGPDDMCARLRRFVGQGVRRIAVAGGDGTAALAARELAHTGVALGIVPQGTANNFATALRLPMDLPDALRVICGGEEREIDLGRVGDRYFTEAAGVGLFADVLALYGGANKNIFRGAYSLSRILFAARPRSVRLFVDGELHTERAVMVTVANSFRMAYAVPVAPGAKLTDGELDVVVMGEVKRHELLRYFRAMRAQVHESLPEVTRFQAREVRIEGHHRMNVHVDDTVVGTTPVTISAAPRALKVLVERL